MNLKLGISVYSIMKQDVDALLYFVAENGFDAVELWDSQSGAITPIHIEEMERADISVALHAPLLDLGEPSNLRTNVSRLNKTVRKAGTYGATVVVLHTGSIPSNYQHNLALNVAHDVIEHVLETVEEEGVLLCIENVGYIGNDLLRDFYQIREFVERYPENLVGVAFDVPHAEITGDVHTGIDVLRNRIRHIHLSDCERNSNVHHLPLGSGIIDFSYLTNVSFNCMGILEIAPDYNWKRNLLNAREFLREKNIIQKGGEYNG